VIGRFPDETSCLTLVWAVLDLVITNATNGIGITQLDRRQLNRIRYQDLKQTPPEEVNAAWADPTGTYPRGELTAPKGRHPATHPLVLSSRWSSSCAASSMSLWAPLGCAVVARDQAHSMHATEIAVHERVPAPWSGPVPLR
jgi:hypothetical protein